MISAKANTGALSTSTMNRDGSRGLSRERSTRPETTAEPLHPLTPPSFKFLKSADFIYQCRRPLFVARSSEDRLQEFAFPSQEDSDAEEPPPADEVSLSTTWASTSVAQTELERASRRKVSKALLGMATSGSMAPYFMQSGGIEAVLRLLSDSDDVEVLAMCAGCIFQMSTYPEFISNLIQKHVIQNMITLIERGNEEIRFQCSRSLANFSTCQSTSQDTDDSQFLALLISNGMLVALQILFNKCKRSDSVSYALLSLSNIAPSLNENSDQEICVRFTLTAVKRLNVLCDRGSAYFVSEVLNNMTRLAAFTYLLSEEGVLAVLLTLIDQYGHDLQIVASCTEAIVNISSNTKNRRKLVTSGVHSRLISIFDLNDPNASTNLLAMVTNMLRAVIFQYHGLTQLDWV